MRKQHILCYNPKKKFKTKEQLALENIIGNDIRFRREETGISVRKFAQICEISTTYLSQIERGIQPPNTATLLKIYHNLPDSTPSKNDKLYAANLAIKRQPTLLFVLQKLSNLNYSNRVAAYFTASLKGFELINQQQLQTEQVHIKNQAKLITIYQDCLTDLDLKAVPNIPLATEEQLKIEMERIGGAKDLSQAQFSSMVGITEDHFFQIYEQNRIPSSDVLNKIISLLNKLDPEANLQSEQFILKRDIGEYGVRKELVEHPVVDLIFYEAIRYNRDDIIVREYQGVILTALAVQGLVQNDIDEYGHFNILKKLISTYRWMLYQNLKQPG